MLERLAGLHQQTGWLSGLIIDEAEDMPSSSVYRHRFGSLVRAYQLIGYAPARDYIEIKRALRDMHPSVIGKVLHEIRELGGDSLLCLNASGQRIKASNFRLKASNFEPCRR